MARKSLQQVLGDLSGSLAELQEMLAPFLGGGATSAAPVKRSPGRPKKVRAGDAPPKATSRGAKPGRAKSGRKAAGGASDGRALQGRYMGVIRSLTAAQKKEVKALRAEKGVEAAISRAQELKGA